MEFRTYDNEMLKLYHLSVPLGLLPSHTLYLNDLLDVSIELVRHLHIQLKLIFMIFHLNIPQNYQIDPAISRVPPQGGEHEGRIHGQVRNEGQGPAVAFDGAKQELRGLQKPRNVDLWDHWGEGPRQQMGLSMAMVRHRSKWMMDDDGTRGP